MKKLIIFITVVAISIFAYKTFFRKSDNSYRTTTNSGIDMKKVSKIFADTLDTFTKTAKAAEVKPSDQAETATAENTTPQTETATTNSITPDAAKDATEITEAKPEAETFKPLAEEEIKSKQDQMDGFMKLFSENLNKAKLTTYPLAANFSSKGSVQGFKDSNKNLKKDPGEDIVFAIEADNKNKTLVAYDYNNHDYYHHHRYHSSWHSGIGGMFTGYFIGSMVGRQFRSGGFGSSSFRHKSSYRTRTPSYSSSRSYGSSSRSYSSGGARSYGGSRSFSGGK